MKRIFTLFFAFFTFATVAFAQECAPEANVHTNGTRIFLIFDSEADASAFFDSVGGSVAVTLSNSVTGQLFTTNNGPHRLRIELTSSLTPGPYTGTITMGGVSCTYVDGVLQGTALPVELMSFEGIKRDHQINLNWNTASENNNEGFVIERGLKTVNGIAWNRLDFVEGNGTTHELQAYSFIDQKPQEGINYYRLMQMDYDGTSTYSSVVAVEYTRENGNISIALFPNPVKDQLTLTNGVGNATIYNVLGQPVKEVAIAANQATIQLSDLLKGQYFLQLLQQDGTVVTKPFAKY